MACRKSVSLPDSYGRETEASAIIAEYGSNVTAVGFGAGVGVTVGVGVGVAVGFGVGVTVAEGVGVTDGLIVGVRVGVGGGSYSGRPMKLRAVVPVPQRPSIVKTPTTKIVPSAWTARACTPLLAPGLKPASTVPLADFEIYLMDAKSLFIK